MSETPNKCEVCGARHTRETMEHEWSYITDPFCVINTVFTLRATLAERDEDVSSWKTLAIKASDDLLEARAEVEERDEVIKELTDWCEYEKADAKLSYKKSSVRPTVTPKDFVRDYTIIRIMEKLEEILSATQAAKGGGDV